MQNQSITQEEIAIKLKKTVRTVERNINILKDKGIITRVGSKKSGYWGIL